MRLGRFRRPFRTHADLPFPRLQELVERRLEPFVRKPHFPGITPSEWATVQDLPRIRLPFGLVRSSLDSTRFRAPIFESQPASPEILDQHQVSVLRGKVLKEDPFPIR